MYLADYSYIAYTHFLKCVRYSLIVFLLDVFKNVILNGDSTWSLVYIALARV